MAKVYQFNPQIYPRILWITVSSKRFENLFEGCYEEIPDYADACTDKVYDNKNKVGGVLIRFASVEVMTSSNISHESVHAADCILDYIGAKTDESNDEYLAYLVGWIADCCDKVKELEMKRLKNKK